MALSQAGQYIHETQISFTKYLERYETRLKPLLIHKPGIWEYRNGSFTATLSLSYETLKARDPIAAAFLALCRCLDDIGIFWELFNFGLISPDTDSFPRAQVPMCPWIKGLVADRVLRIQNDEKQCDNAIRPFLTFSFVTRDVESRNVLVHRIVHQWIPSLYDPDIQQNFCGTVAELAGRSFLLDYTLETVRTAKQLAPLLNQPCRSMRGSGKQGFDAIETDSSDVDILWCPLFLFLVST